jgi:hypothetical protein
MPAALAWLTTAQACFSDTYGCLRQGLLTSIFWSLAWNASFICSR